MITSGNDPRGDDGHHSGDGSPSGRHSSEAVQPSGGDDKNPSGDKTREEGLQQRSTSGSSLPAEPTAVPPIPVPVGFATSDIDPSGSLVLPARSSHFRAFQRTATQILLLQAAELRTPDLKFAKNSLAALVNGAMKELVERSDQAPITVQGGAAPGTFSNALARYQGVGRYFGGEVSVSSQNALLRFSNTRSGTNVAFHDPQTNRMFDHFTGKWQQIHDLPSDTIVGFNGNLLPHSASTIHVYISQREGPSSGETYRIPASDHGTAVDRWRRTQILATMGALHFLGRWIDRQARQTGFRNLMADDLTRSKFAAAQPESYTDIRSVKRGNDAIFRKTLRALRGVNHNGISIGESFTGGALASLFHSVPGIARMIDHAVVWYAPEFKRAFGVRDERLRPQVIAEPETVLNGAQGLIESMPVQPTSSAISTSGWANRHGKGQADFFSVAAISKVGIGTSRVSLKVTVDATADEPLSYRRGELTRNLGVTAGLLALNRTLMELYPSCQSRFYLPAVHARNLIQQYAKYSLVVD